ncbi:MAG TPA: hypothetical protein VF506_16155, partial [Streptosporangiaceae bacterium]
MAARSQVRYLKCTVSGFCDVPMAGARIRLPAISSSAVIEYLLDWPVRTELGVLIAHLKSFLVAPQLHVTVF